jgi:hypothetical protein
MDFKGEEKSPYRACLKQKFLKVRSFIILDYLYLPLTCLWLCLILVRVNNNTKGISEPDDDDYY